MEYTTRQASEILGIRSDSISKFIKRGAIKAEKRGRDWFIPQEEIDRYLHESRRNKTVKERFYHDVLVTPSCHIWQGYISIRGYGRFKIGRKSYSAHRIAWELAYGKIPEGFSVCHACDNRACVNPKHLMLGVHGANMMDMKAKNRYADVSGEKNPAAKLTAEQVQEIRTLYATGNYSYSQLAEQFAISDSAIWAITKRRVWKDV